MVQLLEPPQFPSQGSDDGGGFEVSSIFLTGEMILSKVARSGDPLCWFPPHSAASRPLKFWPAVILRFGSSSAQLGSLRKFIDLRPRGVVLMTNLSSADRVQYEVISSQADGKGPSEHEIASHLSPTTPPSPPRALETGFKLRVVAIVSLTKTFAPLSFPVLRHSSLFLSLRQTWYVTFPRTENLC
ncbi:uncharacterized protein BJX67DRAFT_261481 [Aspergillus lucknowensis]|uniref:Uncharacterized protein n=1 Tax=Aspergillus lucknowensis TaxID=176173 RepID=A0ABR4LFS2_9EURO